MRREHPRILVGVVGTGARSNTGRKTLLRGRHLCRKKLFAPLAPLCDPRLHPLLARAERGHFSPRPSLVGVACILGSWRWWPLGPVQPTHAYVPAYSLKQLSSMGWGQHAGYIGGLGRGFSSWAHRVRSTVLGTLGAKTLLALPSGALRLFWSSC